MTARELKELFVKFFETHGHREIPSARLIPENDPTTLFISAGMHPLVPYLLGQPHPLGNRLVDVQKCVRTGDIDCVGDETHHTFFEMLGNWSLGDYFKTESINWSYEFLTDHLKIDPKRLSVTCFAGDDDAPKDTDSYDTWKKLNITDIKFLPKSDNWWGPAGTSGPCGPDTEIFIDGVEIWNNVFMEYNKTGDGKFEKLPKPNVDTGMGVERTTAFLNGFTDDYLTDIWQPIIKKIENLSGKKYSEFQAAMRIIADHVRAAVFIMSDGVEPGNKEAGYILRRLIRRSIRQGKLLGIETNFIKIIGESIFANQHNYAGIYSELDDFKNKILESLDNEEIKFRKTLNLGLREINKLIELNKKVSGQDAFDLYQNYGFPIEMIEEELEKNNLCLDCSDFEKYKKEHIEKSKTLSAGKFKSGLADNSEIITKYHTATHLLHAALKEKIDPSINQAGSNITHERLRFDFNYPQKMTGEQIKIIANRVNEIINQSMEIKCEVLPLKTAIDSGATALFGGKYPDTVTVYGTVNNNFSREICTGPHVNNTGLLGTFKIIKEESAGSGKRRIYAILQ
jgi:alanyl-tRNA synthetase